MKDCLRAEEIKKLLGALGETSTGLRDASLAILMLNTGLRISEALGLEARDVWDFERGGILDEIIIRAEITKSKRERFMPLNEDAKSAIAQAIELIGRENLSASHPLWFGRKKDSLGNPKKLISRSFEAIIKEARIKAGLSQFVTSHSFRHTFITSLIRETKDIQIAADLAGHANLSTTLLYTHRSRDEKALAVQQLRLIPGSAKEEEAGGAEKIIKITPALIEKYGKREAI